MAYYGDPFLPQPHPIESASLAELAAGMTAPPTVEAAELVRRITTRYPQWDPSRISATIRAETNRHDITIPQIAWVMLKVREMSPTYRSDGAPYRAPDAPYE
ncbi:hypothetical protein ODJ79_40435 [Actinoplanes sp. KI2]|uniref:hypothetical protein n=1 Tax=Actinoplanes sp. KI2 TaxID=2983315 RepID=UPI0021D5F43D|nr:hypothetical protein [Actinoplanes sp. KI2]MCU7730021.1 hypothetical protein [Actinoplanes sp. KI2]